MARQHVLLVGCHDFKQQQHGWIAVEGLYLYSFSFGVDLHFYLHFSKSVLNVEFLTKGSGYSIGLDPEDVKEKATCLGAWNILDCLFQISVLQTHDS